MGLVLSQSQSGLVLATQGSDEAACAAALREYDSDLRLVPQWQEGHGRVYKVYRYVGSERPAVFLCMWADDFGKPYAGLSVTGLLDMVKRLDRNNTRFAVVDSDTKNAQMLAAKRKDADAGFDAIADDHRARLEGRLSVSMGEKLQGRRTRKKLKP